MRVRLFVAAVALAGPLDPAAAADVPGRPGKVARAAIPAVIDAAADRADWTARVKWAAEFPKAYPAAAGEGPGVEVTGTFETPLGWKAAAVVFDYWPKDGGAPKAVEGVKIDGGRFGAIDPETKKVVPFRAAVEPGEWNMRVLVTYERKVDGRPAKVVPVVATLVVVEVK